ncbi:hypothetical protein GQ53DRAFT_855884, partial [Thozetella sp. PMI_491]
MLIIREPLPLEPRVRDATRMAAKKELEGLNVAVITGAQVTNVATDKSGSTTLQITKTGGTVETLKTDLVFQGASYVHEYGPGLYRGKEIDVG